MGGGKVLFVAHRDDFRAEWVAQSTPDRVMALHQSADRAIFRSFQHTYIFRSSSISKIIMPSFITIRTAIQIISYTLNFFFTKTFSLITHIKYNSINKHKLKTNRTGVLIHADNVDSKAFDQIKLIANHPSLKGLISIMPDVHAGAGCVIGFKGKFGNSVIPNLVGVDLGCVVISHALLLKTLDLASIYDYI